VTTLVLDASVAAKWFLPAAGEPFASEALGLLQQYATGQLRFIVPDLFWAEFGNILWKAVRQRRWSRGSAEAALTTMRDQNLPTVGSAELLVDAFAIATNLDRTVYDGLYIAAAILCSASFVTADERLANAVAAQLPVKWLGAV
jgi:predicted nucleic acid-binding protein